MPSPKRILILTADSGFGHRAAAKALAAALRARYWQESTIEVVNPLDDERTPLLMRRTQADWDRVVREMPDLYRFGYQASDARVPAAVLEQAFTVMLFEVVRRIVRRYHPDVIVTTYPSYLAPLDALFAITRREIPLVTVITDLATVHRIWFNDVADLTLVPTRRVYDLAMEYNLPPDEVRSTGIPVSPAFATPPADRRALRRELGWHKDPITVLAVGSRRVEHLGEVLHALNHSGFDIQLGIVTGGDEELRAQLEKTTWHVPAHIYGFVENVPTLMHASDMVLSKAGGLIVTESLAAGLPLMLADVIQGQETGNAAYVVEEGAGELTRNGLEVLEVLAHWLEKDGALLQERARRARELGCPHAAYDAAELIWQAAQRGPITHPERGPGMQRIVDLLNRFNVPWKEEE